jgi:hypothetical protein
MAVCAAASRCHVAGKGITSFGTKFSQAKVLELASSSVLLIDAGASLHVASGVLITPHVLLCASHSLSGATAKLQGQLLFECDAKTAPGVKPSGSPSSCTPLTTGAHMNIGRVIEDGKDDGLDYALCAVTWIGSQITLPRKVTLPKPDYYYGGALLATGHPVTSYKGAPTQASAGALIAAAAHGPHPNPSGPAYSASKEYTYATFNTIDGMSGGGVFNEKGHLVGIVTGYRHTATGNEYGFLNLGLVAGKTVTHGGVTTPASARLKQWLGGGPPLLASDPQPAAGVTFNPPL